MIDSLARLLPKALARWSAKCLRDALPVLGAAEVGECLEFGLKPYGLVTLHRPSNVDSPVLFARIMDTLSDISRHLPLIFSLHPRTRQRLDGLQFATGDS